MIRTMLRQAYCDMIPMASAAVPVANKTGELENVRNDAAIVDPFGHAPTSWSSSRATSAATAPSARDRHRPPRRCAMRRTSQQAHLAGGDVAVGSRDFQRLRRQVLASRWR